MRFLEFFLRVLRLIEQWKFSQQWQIHALLQGRLVDLDIFLFSQA
jgi:hypothetical protein